MEKIASSIGFSNFFSIGPKGRAGGICMLWSNSVDMKVLKFNPNLMAITIRDAVCEWTLVGFYGPPHKTKRKKSLDQSPWSFGICQRVMGGFW